MDFVDASSAGLKMLPTSEEKLENAMSLLRKTVSIPHFIEYRPRLISSFRADFAAYIQVKYVKLRLLR